MIRPDDLVITGSANANALPVRVRVCEYQGRHFAVEGVTTSDVTVHCHADHPLAPGDEVAVVVAPERVRVYPTGFGAADAVEAGLVVASGNRP